MADIGTTLKEKIGPLPLYVWLLIMTGVALAAYFLLKGKKQPTTGTPGTPCTQTDGSAGVWDSTGTVCQAVTVSTVNQPGMDLTQQTGTATPVPPPPMPTPGGGRQPWVPPPAPNPAPGPGPGTGGQTPATVTGLHVTTHSQNSIGIAWSASANATSYQVRVTYQSKVIQTHMTTGTTFTITGLTANHTYGIHVVAINGSHWAPEASITQKTDS